MKKLLLTTFIFTLFACVQATASMIIVDYQGETRAYQQTVERHLVFNSNDDGVYDIAVRPLEEALQSIDGKVQIPLRYLFINNKYDYHLTCIFYTKYMLFVRFYMVFCLFLWKFGFF